jgi:hypothetical protein
LLLLFEPINPQTHPAWKHLVLPIGIVRGFELEKGQWLAERVKRREERAKRRGALDELSVPNFIQFVTENHNDHDGTVEGIDYYRLVYLVLMEPGQEDLVNFLKENRVKVVWLLCLVRRDEW